MKDLAGVKVKCDNLQGLVDKHCSGNLGILVNDICDYFESVLNDFIPLSPDNASDQIDPKQYESVNCARIGRAGTRVEIHARRPRKHDSYPSRRFQQNL